MSMTPHYATPNQANDLYYRHSGMIPISGLVITLVGGLTVGVVGAIAYAYLVRWIPILYLRVLLPVALGALIGFVVGRLARAGRLRNKAITLALVLLVTLIAYYFTWVFWIKATFDRFVEGHDLTVRWLITSPRMLWTAISFLNETGTWSFKRSDPVSGWFLGLIWLIEAGVIFVLALGTWTATAGDDVYCETCDKWAPDGAAIRRTVPGDPATARQRLAAHDFAYLDTLPADSETSSHWWSFNYRRCPGCDNLHALSLIETRITTDSKGNTSTKTTKIVDKLLLSPQEAQRLAAGPPAPPPAPPEVSNTPSEPDDGA